MKNATAKMPKRQQSLKRVGQNLFRSDVSGRYYGIFKSGRKQIRRSLKTTDPKLAQRRVDGLRGQVGRLSTEDGRKLTFAEDDAKGELIGGLAHRWIGTLGVEPTTRDRYLGNIEQLARTFGRSSVRGITARHVEQWARQRKCAAETFKKDLDVLRRILDYGVEHGLLLDNPTNKIGYRTPSTKAILIPSREEFRQLISRMRANGAGASTDLAEALAHSGCRKSEVTGSRSYGWAPMCWRDVNWRTHKFVVTRSKNHKAREVPLFPAFAKALRSIQGRLPNPPRPDDPIVGINSATTAIKTACRQLGFPKYGHHTMRHFFVSNAIEAGVDFGTIAGWVGHSDGGVLLARTYGHLRNEHSDAMAQRMDWDDDGAVPPNVIPFPSTTSQ